MKIIKLILCSIIFIQVLISSKRTKRSKNCNELKGKADEAFRAVTQATIDYKFALRRVLQEKINPKLFKSGEAKEVLKGLIKVPIFNVKNEEKKYQIEDELLSVIDLDWEEEIVDVLRLAKVLRVLKMPNQLDLNVLESYEGKKNLAAYRRDLLKDDEIRITRRIKTINKESRVENLFNALREVKDSEYNTQLEKAETALEQVNAEIKNCNFSKK
jgi:hypothetical protein